MAKAKERLVAIGPVRKDDGLLALLLASVKKGKRADASALAEEVKWAREAGVLNEDDEKKIRADVEAGVWESVDSMRAYIARHRTLELVP
jgi:hypothetical protein